MRDVGAGRQVECETHRQHGRMSLLRSQMARTDCGNLVAERAVLHKKTKGRLEVPYADVVVNIGDCTHASKNDTMLPNRFYDDEQLLSIAST